MSRTVKKWAGLTREQLASRWGRESVHLYGAVDSTNDLAKELVEEGAPEGTVVLAREQRAGRGRSGRSWFSPEGGLYLSLVLYPEQIESPGALPVLAGLGVAERLDRAFPGLSPALKWPNDLYVEGRKLAGILCETSWADERPAYLVVGLGLNVRAPKKRPPAAVRGRAAFLDRVLEREVPLLEVADAALAGLEERLRLPCPVLEGATLDRLDRYDWLKGRRARLFPPAESGKGEESEGLPGVSVGIAPDGALLFRPDRGALRRVQSGEVRVEEPGE